MFKLLFYLTLIPPISVMYHSLTHAPLVTDDLVRDSLCSFLSRVVLVFRNLGFHVDHSSNSLNFSIISFRENLSSILLSYTSIFINWAILTWIYVAGTDRGLINVIPSLIGLRPKILHGLTFIYFPSPIFLAHTMLYRHWHFFFSFLF